MIFPTANEILRCVDQTLLDASDIDMPRMSVKSALATSRHMIRHVELRMQLEHQILLDDIEKTTTLLGHIAGYLDSHVASMRDQVKVIQATLMNTLPLLLGTAEDMDRIRQRTLSLREQIYAVLKALQGLPTDVQSTEAYRETRRLIREYIAYEIQQEAKLIHPAFSGKGPRR